MRKIMKLHLIILMFLLNAFYLQSAELTIEGYGTDKMSPTYNYDKDKIFMVWTAKTHLDEFPKATNDLDPPSNFRHRIDAHAQIVHSYSVSTCP